LEQWGFYEDDSIRKLWDLGTGTGFLGIHFARRNRAVWHVLFSDLTARHEVLVKYNSIQNLAERILNGLQLDVMISGDLGFPPHRDFDLILCTPPYLPRQDVYLRTAKIESPTHGTDLLEKVILNGGKYTKKLVIEFSSIAWNEFKRCVEESGASFRELGRKRVPFRVSPVEPVSPEESLGSNWMVHPNRAIVEADYFEKRQYTDFLKNERGLIPLEGPEARNFKYWQEILVYEVDYTAARK
jgi:SAM-dependent methyltransferase